MIQLGLLVISLSAELFSIGKKGMIMKSDERRSHRLNYLLKCYLTNPKENDLYLRAKQMGISDSTAKDYIRTVIIQAQKIYSR
ncbi:hypothetical protein NADRNF5_0369 [Nitrosopumilus adriaticus]|uniref:Uncharacterized protein n=2 Tax=Nitrosopumilus adriaticus TaxID=1580092 RepID=A0A0D5C155_9ARCH|nr:hypothetical protein NADRNF5_0369 [Nitrosopumilus adriaticus]